MSYTADALLSIHKSLLQIVSVMLFNARLQNASKNNIHYFRLTIVVSDPHLFVPVISPCFPSGKAVFAVH